VIFHALPAKKHEATFPTGPRGHVKPPRVRLRGYEQPVEVFRKRNPSSCGPEREVHINLEKTEMPA